MTPCHQYSISTASTRTKLPITTTTGKTVGQPNRFWCTSFLYFAVLVFTPEALLETVQPDILVKGGDYTEDEVIGAEIVRSAGGSVRVLSLVEMSSTSHIVKRIKES